MSEHTTEEDFEHFLAYSNLKVDREALRWAFYAGRNENRPEFHEQATRDRQLKG